MRKESAASRRGANSIAVREEKLAECARLGISMTELKRRRLAERETLQDKIADFNDEWGLT